MAKKFNLMYLGVPLLASIHWACSRGNETEKSAAGSPSPAAAVRATTIPSVPVATQPSTHDADDRPLVGSWQSLKESLGTADLIFIGSVKRVAESGAGPQGMLDYDIYVGVERCLKGNASDVVKVEVGASVVPPGDKLPSVGERLVCIRMFDRQLGGVSWKILHASDEVIAACLGK